MYVRSLIHVTAIGPHRDWALVRAKKTHAPSHDLTPEVG